MEKYILTLDIGTTTIRAFIYNYRSIVVGKATDQVILHYPRPGYVEIDPEELWTSVVEVVHQCMKDAHLSADQITAMGISTQRSTFITWSRKTGMPFHRFITWKDMRADDLVRSWNASYTWKTIKAVCYSIYLVSRCKKFLAGSAFKFMNTQTTLRLYWALQNVPLLKTAVQSGDAMFGTLDTWMLYKLTGGKVHVTDVSSASATGFYDPFTLKWADWALLLFKIPASILPEVVDTAGTHFHGTEPSIWGHHIPIISSMADQTASMWGSCCFNIGDVKLTIGTGTFLDINTGSSPHGSVSGIYPVVGWKLGNELVYAAESANNDTASILKWAHSLGLFDKPEDTSDIVESVPNTDGVYFVPAFSGIGPPYNDSTAASGFVGLKPSTTKAHLVRSLLEAISFLTARLYECARAETNSDFKTIRVDGGVSNNDFILQLVADLTGLCIERPVHTEMSSLGCAYVIGLYLGIWKSKEELKVFRKVSRKFRPRPQNKEHYKEIICEWEDALNRLCGWNKEKCSKSAVDTYAKDTPVLNGTASV